MKRDLQNQFFKEYRLGGIVDVVIRLIRDKYNLGFYEREEPLSEEIIQFNNKHEEYIKGKVEEFDESILVAPNSHLFQEIEDNLIDCKTEKDRIDYVYSLIVEFNEISEILYPQYVFKKSDERQIEENKRDRLIWQESNRSDVQKQIEAIDRSNINIDLQMRRREVISEKFRRIASQPEKEDTFIEETFSRFTGLMSGFANRLDALCLRFGMDLLELQKECGVWLKWHRLITDVDYYVGSMELARKYIDELPKSEPQNKDEKPQDKTDYRKFLDLLSEYISGIGVDEFQKVVEFKELSPGSIKAKWIGKTRADAWRFAKNIGMKVAEFNKCFSMPDGIPLRNNDKNETTSPILDILKNYLKK